MAEQTVKELQAEVKRLQEELGKSHQQRDAAQEMAHAMASAGQYVTSTSEEQATGRVVSVNVCVNPTERNLKKQRFMDVDYPTYYYNIQLPPAAGTHLSTNGIEYYHGETYEFDPFTLAEIKSRVARCWDHEKSIHGSNENAYRKQTNRLISKASVGQSH